MDIETDVFEERREGGEALEAQARESFLFRIQQPVWKYVLHMWLIGFVPSVTLAIALSVTGVLTGETGPDLSGNLHPAVMFFAIVVFSPVVETLAMGVVLKLLSLVTRRRYALAAMSCMVWAGLHSLASPLWGLTIAWPFFIFSCSYLAWRRRSWLHAVMVTCVIHLLQNLLPGILLLADEIGKKGW
ncbi:MAG: hypothetical protein JXN61_04985 [Sedimentisphaerales bacterium]|nr:hypothetical protein [Sedimentisphaerales bacterium]